MPSHPNNIAPAFLFFSRHISLRLTLTNADRATLHVLPTVLRNAETQIYMPRFTFRNRSMDFLCELGIATSQCYGAHFKFNIKRYHHLLRWGPKVAEKQG
jgi:hypothetical protein